jgi:O-antigen/teichoic acid export membrane protein
MFPLIVQKYNKKENFTNTFKLSLLLVSLPSICLVIFYYFFPHFVITFFAKKEYLSISQYITLFSIFISMYTLVSLLTNLYLAINKTKIWIPVSIAALAQASLIWFNHQSILDVILISLGTTFLLLIVLLLYYPYATKK